ncbi:MAG: peptide-binding protein [Candidatus Margulisiibacteriota bacterium]
MNKTIIIFLLSLTCFFGCAGNSPVKNNGTLVFTLGGDISVLNPILSSDTASSAVEGVVFSGLTKVNEYLDIIPDIAKSWTISKDGRIYTFYLRNDVYWHDGAKLTAYDAKFTFDSILDPKVNSVRRGDYIIDGTAIKFETRGPYIFRAVMPKPFAPFLSRVGMGILPKHLLEGKDINTSEFNSKPVGSGPFIFREWVSADRVVVEQNPRYYGGAPKLEKIVFRIIPDENSRFIALEAGQTDVCDIPAKDYSRAKAMKGVNIFEYESLLYVYLGLNQKKEIFSDKRVRKALAYATDKGQLIQLIFRGLASPAYSPMSPVGWTYDDNVEKYGFNVQNAKRLLDEAGWREGENGIREKDGKKLEFTILVNQGNKEREKAAVILQWQYKKIGVKVNVRVMEWSSLLRILNAKSGEKDFDAVIIGWSLGIDPDSYSIWHSSQYPLGLNFIAYSNKEVDRLLEEGRTTIDKTERKKIYGNIQKIIAEEQPYIFLWYPRSIVAVADRVGGLSKPGPAGLFVDIEKVYIKGNY